MLSTAASTKRARRSVARIGCAQCLSSSLPEHASNSSGVTTKKFSRLTSVISTSLRPRRSHSRARAVVTPPNPPPSTTIRTVLPLSMARNSARTPPHRREPPCHATLAVSLTCRVCLRMYQHLIDQWTRPSDCRHAEPPADDAHVHVSAVRFLPSHSRPTAIAHAPAEPHLRNR